MRLIIDYYELDYTSRRHGPGICNCRECVIKLVRLTDWLLLNLASSGQAGTVARGGRCCARMWAGTGDTRATNGTEWGRLRTSWEQIWQKVEAFFWSALRVLRTEWDTGNREDHWGNFGLFITINWAFFLFLFSILNSQQSQDVFNLHRISSKSLTVNRLTFYARRRGIRAGTFPFGWTLQNIFNDSRSEQDVPPGPASGK